MALKSKYVTIDEFNTYFAVNLESMMREPGSASALLYRTENRVASYLNANFYKNIDTIYPVFTDYQKEHYKLALMEQVMYVIKNGDLSLDSGYDSNSGIVASRTQLKSIIMCENAKQELILCGLWNTHIGRKGVYYDRFIF